MIPPNVLPLCRLERSSRSVTNGGLSTGLRRFATVFRHNLAQALTKPPTHTHGIRRQAHEKDKRCEAANADGYRSCLAMMMTYGSQGRRPPKRHDQKER